MLFGDIVIPRWFNLTSAWERIQQITLLLNDKQVYNLFTKYESVHVNVRAECGENIFFWVRGPLIELFLSQH